VPGREQAMIDFLGIGAQKCGTTWLYHNLDRHPQITFPAGKELHRWGRHRLSRGEVEAWLALFPPAPSSIKQGEITPAYGFLSVEDINDIHAVAPQLRLFYCVRNPMARAWSAALMALQRAELTIDEASDQWFLDHFRSRGSFTRGSFPACIERWQSVFPPDSLHIVVFDDIGAIPREVLRRLALHLEIDEAFYDTVPEKELSEPGFVGPRHPLRPELLPTLCEIYGPTIDRVQVLLGRDLSVWKNWDGTP
jgi:hypothetical protein